MHGDVDRLARSLERVDQLRGHAAGIGDRHARVPAQHLDVRHRAQALRHVGDAARREHERVAAGQDHLPDAGIGGDVGDRPVERLAGKGGRPRGPHRLAAEAEAAVDRADVRELQQHAVGIAVHHAGDGREALVADGIGQLFGRLLQLAHIGHELPRDRVGGVASVDQRQHVGRDGHRVALGDALQRRRLASRRQARVGQLGDRPQRLCVLLHASVARCHPWRFRYPSEPICPVSSPPQACQLRGPSTCSAAACFGTGGRATSRSSPTPCRARRDRCNARTLRNGAVVFSLSASSDLAPRGT